MNSLVFHPFSHSHPDRQGDHAEAVAHQKNRTYFLFVVAAIAIDLEHDGGRRSCCPLNDQ